ncbi:MAG TPA: hypothetical protein VKU02_33050 [Gemmataceae bacterium]|nr:hypothetical protein [Gemmataceae bacterium]
MAEPRLNGLLLDATGKEWRKDLKLANDLARALAGGFGANSTDSRKGGHRSPEPAV